MATKRKYRKRTKNKQRENMITTLQETANVQQDISYHTNLTNA
jgi:hypothetical protein